MMHHDARGAADLVVDWRWRSRCSGCSTSWKPWPIREIDHGMRGGAGIMLDDVMAGILAALVLLLIRYIT